LTLEFFPLKSLFRLVMWKLEIVLCGPLLSYCLRDSGTDTESNNG